MTNERNGGGGGSGNGADSVDDISGANDATVVISPDAYLLGALERIPVSLRGAADRCDGLRGVVEETGPDVAFDELEDEMIELKAHAEGAIRAIQRLRKLSRKRPTTKERP